MNWAAQYNRLIEQARSRNLAGYAEKHHVIPRCLGGGENKENIVRLTPEEHYIAHQLLVKMHPDRTNLVWAAVKMTRKLPGRRNKLYGWLRRRLSEMLTGAKRRPHSAETRAKMAAAAFGKPKSIEHRAALSIAKTGKQFHWSSEHKSAHAVAVGKFNRERSKAFMRTPEYRAQKSAEMKVVWVQRKATQGACLGGLSEV